VVFGVVVTADTLLASAMEFYSAGSAIYIGGQIDGNMMLQKINIVGGIGEY
jgi:hypothetical protein